MNDVTSKVLITAFIPERHLMMALVAQHRRTIANNIEPRQSRFHRLIVAPPDGGVIAATNAAARPGAWFVDRLARNLV